jgi:hypothetical protein
MNQHQKQEDTVTDSALKSTMKATADDNTKIQATHQWGNIGKSIIQKASK